MRLRALIFDVDGTLADTEEIHRRAFNAAFAEHGLPWKWNRPTYAALLKVTGGKERIAHFIAGLGLSAADATRMKDRVPDVHRAKTRRYAEMLAAGAVRLRPGVERLVQEARCAGVKLAIASTTSAENVAALLQRALGAQWRGWFDTLACGDSVPRKKPAADVYFLALDRLGVAAERCIAFEDSANGVAAARAAGLYTVATPCDWTAAEDFSGADLLLPDLAELKGLEELRSLHAFWLAEQPQVAA